MKPSLNPTANAFVPGFLLPRANAKIFTRLEPSKARETVQEDSETITHLRQVNASLVERLNARTIQLSTDTDAVAYDAISSREAKRTAKFESPVEVGDKCNGHNEYEVDGRLHYLANKISKDLDKPVSNETIHLCGLAPLRIISTRPQDVLDLAYQKLHTWPYAKVPTCWLRLFEDASLFKVIQLLRDQTYFARTPANASKRRKLKNDDSPIKDWMSEVIPFLDKGATLSGAPGRKDLFNAVFQELEAFIRDETYDDLPATFAVRDDLKTLHTDYAIVRAPKAISFEEFQTRLDRGATPVIIPGTMKHWPAIEAWHHPAYLLRRTLGGRRLVPVEIGSSYTEDGWKQSIISFRQFIENYLLVEQPADVGYLAQHDLFAQIPALRSDVMVPDYCYASPPPAAGPTLQTAGLNSARQLEVPLLNAWLGPKGTKTPLHTDPHHNILCQVVGYKYVRLYSPKETPRLYPRGSDESGIAMENTSQVDVFQVRSRALGGLTDVDAVGRISKDFPLFQQAKYQEAVLRPGECLYIPLGWWHYVESLATSFSVSFWWN